MPVHINLWCFQGRPPTDGEPVEVVIRAFTFTPLEATAAPPAAPQPEPPTPGA
jgi:hypothetical protein